MPMGPKRKEVQSIQHTPSSWLALRVTDVDEMRLVWNRQGRIGLDNLPVQHVHLPVKDSSTVAVLSWRWDFDAEGEPSKNMVAAVRHARRVGIQYLFIDTISIDQTLPDSELMEQVISFTSLYRTIPVIAAYSKIGEKLDSTMRRPWILSECRIYRNNPTTITHVGYTPETPKKGWDFAFSLEHVWTSNYIITLMGVLSGEIGMTSISDFRFIIPEYAEILTVAFQKMGARDYLITTAILCQASLNGFFVTDCTLEQYPDFQQYVFQDSGEEGIAPSYNVMLGDKLIGIWDRIAPSIPSHRLHKFDIESDAERTIFTFLGLSKSDFEQYVLKQDSRRSSIFVKSSPSGYVRDGIESVVVDF